LRGEFSGLIYGIKLFCKRIKLLERIRRGNTWKEYEITNKMHYID